MLQSNLPVSKQERIYFDGSVTRQKGRPKSSARVSVNKSMLENSASIYNRLLNEDITSQHRIQTRFIQKSNNKKIKFGPNKFMSPRLSRDRGKNMMMSSNSNLKFFQSPDIITDGRNSNNFSNPGFSNTQVTNNTEKQGFESFLDYKNRVLTPEVQVLLGNHSPRLQREKDKISEYTETALMYLQKRQPQDALEILRLCESILVNPDREIQVSDAIQQLQSHQQFKVFSAIAECYNQMRQHKLNLKYLKIALDHAQNYHRLENQKSYASYEYKKQELWDREKSTNVFTWIERGISELMYSMTISILQIQNYHEALIYSIQSNLWGLNCIKLLKDVLTEQSQYLQSKDEEKFYNMAQTYFEVCRFYAMSLKNTGDIFQHLDQYDQAKKYYTQAKVFLHGNFRDFGDIHYSQKADQDMYNEYRIFVTDYLYGVQSKNSNDQQNIVKDIKSQQNSNKLKERYSNKSVYMAMSKEYGLNQDYLLRSKLNTNKKAYVSRDVDKLIATDYESINYTAQSPIQESRISEIDDTEQWTQNKGYQNSSNSQMNQYNINSNIQNTQNQSKQQSITQSPNNNSPRANNTSTDATELYNIQQLLQQKDLDDENLRQKEEDLPSALKKLKQARNKNRNNIMKIQPNMYATQLHSPISDYNFNSPSSASFVKQDSNVKVSQSVLKHNRSQEKFSNLNSTGKYLQKTRPMSQMNAKSLSQLRNPKNNIKSEMPMMHVQMDQKVHLFDNMTPKNNGGYNVLMGTSFINSDFVSKTSTKNNSSFGQKRRKSSKYRMPAPQFSDIKQIDQDAIPFKQRIQHLLSDKSKADYQIEKQLEKIEHIRAELLFARKQQNLDQRVSKNLVKEIDHEFEGIKNVQRGIKDQHIDVLENLQIMSEQVEGSNLKFEKINQIIEENQNRQHLIEKEQMENLKQLKKEIQESNKVNNQLINFRQKGSENAGDYDLNLRTDELVEQVTKLKEIQSQIKSQIIEKQETGTFIDHSVQVTLTDQMKKETSISIKSQKTFPAESEKTNDKMEKKVSEKILSVREKIITQENEIESECKTESIHAENIIRTDVKTEETIKSEAIEENLDEPLTPEPPKEESLLTKFINFHSNPKPKEKEPEPPVIIEEPKPSEPILFASDNISEHKIEIENPQKESRTQLSMQESQNGFGFDNQRLYVYVDYEENQSVLYVKVSIDMYQNKKIIGRKLYHFQVDLDQVLTREQFVRIFEDEAKDRLSILQFESEPYTDHVECIKEIIKTIMQDKIQEKQEELQRKAKAEEIEVVIDVPEIEVPVKPQPIYHYIQKTDRKQAKKNKDFRYEKSQFREPSISSFHSNNQTSEQDTIQAQSHRTQNKKQRDQKINKYTEDQVVEFEFIENIEPVKIETPKMIKKKSLKQQNIIVSHEIMRIKIPKAQPKEYEVSNMVTSIEFLPEPKKIPTEQSVGLLAGSSNLSQMSLNEDKANSSMDMRQAEQRRNTAIQGRVQNIVEEQQKYEAIKQRHTVYNKNSDMGKLDEQIDPLPCFDDIVSKLISDKNLFYKDLQVYQNGSVYRGQMMEIKNKDGEIQNTVRHGYGIKQFEDGSRYSGIWSKNMPNGHGTFNYSNGDVYTGNFSDGVVTGNGEMTRADGETYKGKFDEDEYHGTGLQKLSDGTIYGGQFIKGQRQGNGSIKYPNGDSYKGQFYRNGCSGFGEFKWKDGKVYLGEMQNGQMHGSGVLKLPSGVVYDGCFKQGKKNGKGKETNPTDNTTFQGTWQNDMRVEQ